ncbi:hypothetical protein EMIT0196MI5_90200 [Pseudomonas sp. IT-196MI5]
MTKRGLLREAFFMSSIQRPTKNPVGAGLPAKASVHPISLSQTDRFREQARSHNELLRSREIDNSYPNVNALGQSTALPYAATQRFRFRSIPWVAVFSSSCC